MVVHQTKWALRRWMCSPLPFLIPLMRICVAHHLLHLVASHFQAGAPSAVCCKWPPDTLWHFCCLMCNILNLSVAWSHSPSGRGIRLRFIWCHRTAYEWHPSEPHVKWFPYSDRSDYLQRGGEAADALMSHGKALPPVFICAQVHS